MRRKKLSDLLLSGTEPEDMDPFEVAKDTSPFDFNDTMGSGYKDIEGSWPPSWIIYLNQRMISKMLGRVMSDAKNDE